MLLSIPAGAIKYVFNQISETLAETLTGLDDSDLKIWAVVILRDTTQDLSCIDQSVDYWTQFTWYNYSPPDLGNVGEREAESHFN